VGAWRGNENNRRPIKIAGILPLTWTQDPQTQSTNATHEAIMSGYSLYAKRLVLGLSASMQQGISLKFRYEWNNLLYKAPFCFCFLFKGSLGIVAHCICPEWKFSIGGITDNWWRTCSTAMSTINVTGLPPELNLDIHRYHTLSACYNHNHVSNYAINISVAIHLWFLN